MDISNNYKMFIEAVPGLMVIDTDGNLVYINDQCADYIKCDKEKATGMLTSHRTPPSKRKVMRAFPPERRVK